MLFVRSILLVAFLFCFSCQATQQLSDANLATKNPAWVPDELEKHEGFFTYYWDAKKGKVWLEIDRWNEEFLYVSSLPAGIGSNDIGLDRGQLGARKVVRFIRSGPKVLLIQSNYDYRANSDNPAERKAVEQAFAQSVIAGFTIDKEENGKAFVDATEFFLSDAHDVVGQLKRTDQGSYKLDQKRSAFYLPNTKNFPQNTEVEVWLTFAGEPKGNYVRQVVPSPESITVRQHHSFIQLPDDGYQTRAFDPRSGYNALSYADYSVPISESIEKRLTRRHRLIKKDPNASNSEATEPIIYYLDPGAPEPIRSALLEGARWWNQAFEAAGYTNAFQVEVLPQDADPMDIRYNVIQWVHRSTRGWSYGSSVTDPRTGEILKGHVSLGSLRVRQDFMIAQGLLAPFTDSTRIPPEMEAMALARLRQLSAHEVGHTLGLAHNFAASTNDRSSVMDYPHPWVTVNDQGQLDVSNAYEIGIGSWDKVAIAYGYQDFPEGTNTEKELDKILDQAFDQGLRFISDRDARPQGGAHAYAHLWDNGSDPVTELNRVMKVRAIALNNFSESNIPVNTPMAKLEDVIVPIYLFHRYQVEATAKLIGGLDYSYALRGDSQTKIKMVSAEQQQQALAELLKTLSPPELQLPQNILIPPQPIGYGRDRENFKSRTGLSFDPLSLPETSASLTISLLLHPQRASRLVSHRAQSIEQPGLGYVIDQLIAVTLKKRSVTSVYQAEIQRIVATVMLHQLMKLSRDTNAHQQARAISHQKVIEISSWLQKQLSTSLNSDWLAFYSYQQSEIRRFLNSTESFLWPELKPSPPGSPIGSRQLSTYSCQPIY